ncbi:Uncharacterized protein Adt_26677 [Abeliophyllum distichum]|uniref:Uncharacterized protein n=1 Tax=Abeliophyllum distichum TaxID=126358 RepID=A0ABD1RVM8_9LAMI
MDFQHGFKGHRGRRYERLRSDDDKVGKPKWCWMKKMNGKLKGLRLLQSRKLIWKPFSINLILSRRIARIYADIVEGMKMDEICPAIVFSCQWGLPILSHSSVRSRKRFVSY